jgi:thioredoxin reductase (NADPH)
VGGGNTAVEEALYLTHHADHVTLIHRRAALRAEKILQARLLVNPKISVVWDSVVEEIVGGGTPEVVEGVRLRDVKSETSSVLAVDGVFIAIGHTPNTAVFAGHVDMDADGYVLTKPGSTRTSVPGVFAAGDVQDKVFRQAVTAAGTGCMAALEAEKFLAEEAAALAGANVDAVQRREEAPGRNASGQGAESGGREQAAESSGPGQVPGSNAQGQASLAAD